MAQGRSGSGSGNHGRGGAGRGFGKNNEFRGGKPGAGGRGKGGARGGAGFGSSGTGFGGGKPGKPGKSGKPGAGKAFGSKGGKPGAKGGAGKSGASRGFRSGPAFASERGEYRPNYKHQRNDNYAGPHRPRRPKNAPVDHYEFYDHDGVRLQKLMAQAGVASRRVCEQMIEEGRVTVNGETVTELGVRVDADKVEVHVDGMRIQTNDKLIYMVLNKPTGVVSSMGDPDGRPDISNFLRKSMSQRVFHVGRLDVETEGLLLLTNDGELANRLTHPSYEVPKTYLVQVPGPMEQGIGAAMKKGIRLEDGVSRVDSFKLIDSTPGHILIEVTIHSGKNRIVRRLFEAVGHPVEKLVRVQMGPVRLGSQKQGTIRNLSKVEIGELLASVGM
ncbi:pseudouridine synthase [Rothia sp. ZJ932]|uniref:pseudouridine synthase n=1 Tax=Rothia sp. ZJ932 TaxID=2810516 RepID=UPI0019673FF3|nr:pseudouridine synthase [Rothia sp. ZJ932]QRZ60987.1 rRNA pseudouridine synthase [Rothia sp. ZJ932]